MELSKLNSVNPAKIASAGWEGTNRNLEYIKAHKGGAHPYALIFGPLGGLLIPDSDLKQVPQEKSTGAKGLIPESPLKGPPLPQNFGIKWPWSK